MPAKTIRVSDKRFSFARIELEVDGTIITSISEISYSDTLEPGVARGTSPVAEGETIGEYEAEASITFAKEAKAQLIGLLGNGFMTKSFDITVTYSVPGEDTVSDRLLNCRIKGNENSHSSGADALNEATPLYVRYIRWNGYEPIAYSDIYG